MKREADLASPQSGGGDTWDKLIAGINQPNCTTPRNRLFAQMDTRKMLQAIFLIVLICFTDVAYAGLFKSIGKGYCTITHPVEMFFPVRHDNTCEDQHLIQQQHEGSNEGNISIVPASSHIATDTWGGDGVFMQDRVWEMKSHFDSDRWGTSLGAEDALEQSYKAGRYQLEYVFLLYSYRNDEWNTTIFTWDGVSNLLYTISWWANFPSKYIRKLAYLIDKGRYHLIIDHVIQLPFLLAEGMIGIIYNSIGVVSGTILNPMDTLNAVIGGLWLLIKSVVLGIFVDLPLTIFLLLKVLF